MNINHFSLYIMKRLYFIFCLFIFIGCTHKSKAPVNSTLPIFDLTKDYPEKTIDLQEIAEVEYIPLETTEKSVAMIHANPHISEKYIINCDLGGPVHFYDRQGKHLYALHANGQGPQEYYGIVAFTVDFPKEEFYIYDLRKLQVYSFAGEWKRTLKVPEGMRYENLFNYDEHHLICENAFHDWWNVENLSIDKTPYYLINKETGTLTPLPIIVENRISKTMEKRIEHIDAQRARRHFEQMSVITSLMANNKDFLIADFGLDTLYSYKDDVLTPLAVQYPPVHSSTPPVVIAPRFYTDKYLFFKPVEMKFVKEDVQLPYTLAPTLMWDRTNNEIYNVKLYDSEYSEIYLKPRNKETYFEQSNYILIRLKSSRLCEDYEAGKLKGKLREVASRLKDDDNDVFAIYKIK